MSKRYALRITEATRHLVRYLNGDEPENADDLEAFDDEYFIFAITDKNAIESEAILNEDALYDEKGYLKDSDLNIII